MRSALVVTALVTLVRMLLALPGGRFVRSGLRAQVMVGSRPAMVSDVPMTVAEVMPHQMPPWPLVPNALVPG
jgi:hypothetical protein